MKRFIFVLVALIGLSGFSAVYHPEVLDTVVREARFATQQGKQPVAIFDSDDTLLLTAYRTQAILQELADDGRFRNAHPEAAAVFADIPKDKVHFELRDTLRHAGLSTLGLLETVTQYWKPRFFSSEYVENDRVVPGAPSYVSYLHAKGTRIVYLTGRPQPQMEEGTLKNLRKRQFPLGHGVLLIMKPTVEMPDLDFKRQAIDRIKREGDVVAVFENEPANLNLFADAFPEATPVFVDTMHSDKPEVPSLDSVWIRNYLAD